MHFLDQISKYFTEESSVPILQAKRVCPIYPGLQNWEKTEAFWFPNSVPAHGSDQALGWETKD